MTQISAPDGTLIEFPEGMGDDAIKQAMGRLYPAPPPQREDAPFSWGGLAKQTGVGVGQGVIGALGAGGDFADWVGRKTEEYAPGYGQTGRRVAGAIASPGTALFSMGQAPTPPTSAQIRQPIEQLTGEFRKSQNTYEDYGQTFGEFLPNAAMPVRGGANLLAQGLRRFGNVALPAAGAETAGQIAKGTEYEPWARVAGGVAGALGPSMVQRAITPLPANPQRLAQVAALEREGIDLTAGQRVGNDRLRWAESVAADQPFAGGRASRAVEGQKEQLTAAAMRRAGEDVRRAGPVEVDDMFARIGRTFDDLAARNRMPLDSALYTDLAQVGRNYRQMVPPSAQAPFVDNIIGDIVDASARGNTISGASYQALRSRLDRAARGTRDPELQDALYGLRGSLDDAMGRTMSAADQAAWAEARRQYRNALVIEKAATGAGEQTAQGLLSPSQLRAAAVAQNRRAYARGEGDFGELARNAEAIMKPLPQSGTAPRTVASNVLGLGGAGGTISAMAGADPLTALMYAAGTAAAPAAAGRALMSRPAQAYLGNQAMAPAAAGENRRAMLAAALLAGNHRSRAPDMDRQALQSILRGSNQQRDAIWPPPRQGR